VRPLDATRVQELIESLDSDDFQSRNEAQAELEELGPRDKTALAKAIEGKPALEVKKRLEGIIARIDQQRVPPGQIRVLRALEVLERIGTTEARSILEKMAQGANDASLTLEARDALERVKARQSEKR